MKIINCSQETRELTWKNNNSNIKKETNSHRDTCNSNRHNNGDDVETFEQGS